MIDFKKDALFKRDRNVGIVDSPASVMSMTIDDIIVFGTAVYNEYIDIFETAKSVIDISENKDYTLLSFLNENEEELLKMSVPTKLGALFLSEPGFYRVGEMIIPNTPPTIWPWPLKWGKSSLGWKYVDGDFVDLGIGGPDAEELLEEG